MRDINVIKSLENRGITTKLQVKMSVFSIFLGL